MKNYAYYECYKKVKEARMKNPVDTKKLNELRDFYGNTLYTQCLVDIIKKYNLE